ncbi:endonuclease/exonuclease/phosphatase family protein [Oceanobacter antarcticus]|uniref:Endonuclease/exonuclease/phosphatase family protein n=1 Tax=Oceanobacter antarcticus TaxID=3133425 RepID=A0ABW8NEH1_9GAMM
MLRILLLFIATLCLIGLNYWSFTGIFNDRNIVFRYLNYFGYYIPILALFITIAGFCFSRYRSVRALLILLLLPTATIPYYLATADFGGKAQSNLPDNSQSLSSLTLSFVTFSKMSRNNNYSEIAKILDCQKYDVIVVQEISDLDKVLAAKPEIAEHCHYAYAGMPEKFLTIFSKYPISDASADQIANVNMFRVSLPGQNINVLTTRLAKTFDDRGLETQRRQVEQLALLVENLSGATILAGDFNSTPHNYPIFKIKQHMTYASPEGFFMSTFTFPADGRRLGILGALIRIDHIFYKNVVLNSVEVMKNNFGSDHYPVHALFTIPIMAATVQQSKGLGE